MFIDFKEREKKLQPGYAPRMGIKPTTVCCTGRHFNQLSHLARATMNNSMFSKLFQNMLKKIVNVLNKPINCQN